RKHAEREILPQLTAWEEGCDFPDSVFSGLGRNGFLGILVDEAQGGVGGDYSLAAAWCEEFGRVPSVGMTTGVNMHSLIVTPALAKLGSTEAKARFLAPALDGTAIGAYAFTEPGAGSDLQRADEGDQRLPIFGLVPNADDQTIATLDTGLVVTASGYGEPFAYRPEQRPAMAVDGDPSTAWVVGDRSDPVGQFLEVSTTQGTLHLLQPPDTVANRMITSVRIAEATGTATDVSLGPESLVGEGQAVAVTAGVPITITITGVARREGGTDTGPSAVGFAELGLGVNT
ncbi:MAG TPA: acyl-CoA dehydrogenase family protein, partial [Ilumatobacteraceae bacterium]|nr:acyl-CoA dehydrogenase family protein [Ilumatobacteraceae bacterium]